MWSLDILIADADSQPRVLRDQECGMPEYMLACDGATLLWGLQVKYQSTAFPVAPTIKTPCRSSLAHDFNMQDRMRAHVLLGIRIACHNCVAVMDGRDVPHVHFNDMQDVF